MRVLGCPALGALMCAGLGLGGCTRSDDVIATLKATGGQMVDQGGASSQGGASPCALPDGETAALARFDFEDAAGVTTLHDAQDLQDAQMMGGSFAPVAGPVGCGTALGFAADMAFALVPNIAAWDLEVGSIDFWLRVPEAVTGSYGILGRDHLGTDLPGHLSLWLTADRTVTLRLQGATTLATHCSDTVLSSGQWVHVAFNFGPPQSELFIDGALAIRAGDPRVETIVPECGGTTTDGIAGNEQPWVLGFDTSRSEDGPTGLIQHFDGGAIDAFQISAVRRDFQRP